MCLTFSQDGHHVYAAGNLADFGRTTQIDGAIRVSLKEGRADGFVEFPLSGTVLRMTIVNDDTWVIYFSASKELLTLDIRAREFARRTRIYGGFLEATAISPESHHFAVTSQNERNRQSAEPCRLTVFTRGGKQTLSYQFSDEKKYRGAVLCFPTDEQLVLFLPTGKILKWTLAKDRQRWEVQGEPLATVNGPFSAIESSSEAGVIWLARDRTLLAIDSKTGEVRQETDLDVGEPTGNILAEPIECLALLGNRSMVVAGLQDGRLALVPIAQRGK